MLYGDHVRLARSKDQDQLFEAFESDLRLFVAELARDRVFVHAGVVGWKHRAIIIPGRSFSGKTTLVAELVKAGATYYSDEYAVLDHRGRVHPFLKPLEIREYGDTRQKKVEVNQLGGQSGTKPLPVSLVVVSRFRAEAKWRPRKLSPGKGILELLANTVSARRNPEQVFATLQQVAAKAPILKGVRGEASDIVKTILEKSEHTAL
jgi:serine kinase of HPr protein (carbohydrate metabolism regulator)